MTIARIQLRQDTSAGWAAANPVLAKGELGFDTTVNRVKAGDGSLPWTSLAWSMMSSAEIARVMAAAEAIEAAGTPTDAVIATQIGAPASATRQALNATIADEVGARAPEIIAGELAPAATAAVQQATESAGFLTSANFTLGTDGYGRSYLLFEPATTGPGTYTAAYSATY